MSKKSSHADSRMPLIQGEAARLFRTQGFEGTSMRDIASAVGMLPGSLYCHFATKEELLAAVYVKGVQQISRAVQDTLANHTDPWDRLEAACVAHLEAILRDDDYAQVVVRVRPSDAPTVRAKLIELRNRYEAIFTALVKDLPLPRGTDRRTWRLMLLGSLNSSQLWYRAGGRSTPQRIARQFVALMRHGQEASYD